MPPPLATVPQMCTALVRSRLLTADAAKDVYRRFVAERRDRAGDADAFRQFLVERRLLTDYQAALVARGHSDGFVLGKYTIVDRLGKGRSAGVYKAVDPAGTAYALKVLPASKARESNVLARFQREARMATQLDHPNVVRTLEVGEAGGALYLVMEFLDGQSLADVLERRKRLPVPEAVRLVVQALLGVQKIHERKLVHRDLKPANLMVVPPAGASLGETTLGATVKILDVGLGRAILGTATEAEPTPETQLTGQGSLLGTPDYMAPEQARDAHAVDGRADVYSLGCVLYHLLTGQPPFPDTNVLNQVLRHATETPRPLAEFLARVPDGLQQVVDGMMAKDPAQRYATAERAAQALRSFLLVGGSTAPEKPAGGAVPAWVADAVEESSKVVAKPTDRVPVGKLIEPAKAKEPPRETASSGPQERPAEEKLKESPVAEPRDDEFDVELVAIDLPAAADRLRGRSLLDPDRRDAIMLAIGAGGALVAVGLGYGLSRMLSRAPADATEPREPEPQPQVDGTTPAKE
jgi:serine/threonine protein kinase